MQKDNKMKFKEVAGLEKTFEKYLTYEGINLWKLSEAGMYENFFKFPKKRGFFEKKKDIILRHIVNMKNGKKEKEETEKTGITKDLLMVVYGISPINTFKPIIEKLRDKIKVIRYDPPSERTTKDFLEKNKIDYSNIDNYIDDDIKNKLKKSKRWISEKWKEIKKSENLKKDLGENYEIVMDALEYFCSTRKVYLEIIRMIELYNKIFNLEKPKLLIVSDDVNAYGRSAVEIAKLSGIKTICIQHGQLEGNVIVSDGANKLIVNGFKDKEYLISQGVDKNKIEVTGQIRFDDIAEKMKLNKKEVCKKYNLDENKRIIAYSYQKPIPGEDVVESALNCFLKNVEKIDKEKYEIVITMRPDTPKIKKIDYHKNIKLLPGANIQELAVCCDILVTAFSTAAIEFVLMGKPVIAINLGVKENEYIDYTKLGVGFKITKEEDFFSALKKCLKDKNFKNEFKMARENFIKDYNYKLDGKALERVLNEINKLRVWKTK